jgi:hypothetical protein
MPPARNASEAHHHYRGRLACCQCGNVREVGADTQDKRCAYCGNRDWTPR